MTRQKNNFARPILAAILLGIGMLATTAAHAQSGKITAKVVDANTGEPIVRAAVQVLPSKQGAYTKDDGVATIVNVEPNENYTVTASFVGYEKVSIRGVKVQSGITTALKFKLGKNVKDTVVVYGAPKMVEKTKTQVQTNLSTSQVINTPGRQRIEEIVKLTPGTYQDNTNGGISISGSRGTANSIRIGNVETSDPVNGRAGALQSSLSKYVVSEISVTTAGGDASKGNYTGGEINTSTRSGGSQFEFLAHYRQEVPALFGTSANGYKQLPMNDRIAEFAFGGPITDDIKYFVTTRGNTREFYNYFYSPVFSNAGLNVKDPAGNSLGQLPHTNYYTRAVTGKLTFGLFGFALSADALLASESRQYNSRGLLYNDPAQLGASNELNNLYTLSGRGQLGDGILELTASYETLDKNFGKEDKSAKGGLLNLYKIYNAEDKYTFDEVSHTVYAKPDGIIDIYTPVSRQIPDPSDPATPLILTATGINPITGHIEGPGISLSSNNAYGLVGFFSVAGNPYGFSKDSRRQIQLNGKYTQQVGAHLLNGGFEAHLYNVHSEENGLPWDANPFRDSFDVRPTAAAFYIIDKMEFNDITFSPQLRLDLFNPGNDRAITNPYNPVNRVITTRPDGSKDTTIQYAVTTAPIQTQLSPRLGITYAVTDQTTFNFNYGWYFKQPLLKDVLTNTGGDLSRVLQRGNQIIGNGALKAERTKEIVVGFNTQLSDLFAFHVQGIYKDLRNHAGLQRITSPFLPIGYTLYSDDQYGNYRGVQLIAEKRMADNYAVRFNYTYSVAKGTSSSALSNYTALINQQQGSESSALPLQPFNFDYDKPHIAQLIIDVNYDKNQGPMLFGIHPLEWFSFNLTSEFQSGTPYTRIDTKGQQIGEYNGNRNPDYIQSDALLTRTIPFGELFGESMKNMFLDVQLEVTNLFNRTQPIRVFASTGQGDDDGSTAQFPFSQEYYNDPTNSREALGQGRQIDAFGNMYYNARWDLNKDGRVSVDEQQTAYKQLRSDRFAVRSNYQAPRRVFLNLAFRF